MQFEMLEIDITDNVAVVTINRPKALNAMNPKLLTELNMAIAELEVDDEVLVVILTGAGKAFVAGADIAEMAEMSPREAQFFAEIGGAIGLAIEESCKPYIAAVNGFALGGGCELALACDFIYASEKAKLGQPEVKLGVIPGFGGTQRLSRRVGLAKAKELVFTGDIISAEEGLRIGLVDALVAPDELMPKVKETATRIVANGPLAVAEAKRVMQVGASMALNHAIQLEQLAFANLFDSDDQEEGMSAFLAKRPPIFNNR